MTSDNPDYLDGPHGRLAYMREDGAGPGIVWLGGFRSDMTGTKATHLAAWAKTQGRAFLRFDYSGHGASAGRFEDGAISDWAADATAAFDALTAGPQILVGSSMGAWVAALLALARPARIAGLIFIAPAPDFTEELMLPAMDTQTRERLMRDGRIEEPSDYDEPTVITRRLIENGRRNLVLPRAGAITAPARILQGMADRDVPWRHALRFAEALGSADLEVTLTKSGDHRLSSPEDLARLTDAIASLG